MSSGPSSEPDAVAERYARRADAGRYSLLKPDVMLTVQERQRAMRSLFAWLGWSDLAALRATEVGCGAGGNLLELLRMGFAPEHVTGIELLPARHEMARRVLPEATRVWLGDASLAPVEPASQDLVLQSTVFSSLLDASFRRHLAAAMWSWLKPAGGVLWYDFTFNNPRNPDVEGVPLREAQGLFPEGRLRWHRRVTLAPPLARALTSVHPSLYSLFNAIPLLRTHVLAWIEKPA